MLFMHCVCHALASVHCCLVVTCWERADLLALVFDVQLCFVTFPCGILGQVWYLILSIPGLEFIKLEFILRLNIKLNNLLLADTCPQAANHCALC